MHYRIPTHSLLAGVRQILSHGIITLLAVVIAFSLPVGARYILYSWWPRVETDGNLLLITEIALASVLVLLFSIAKLAMDHRQRVATADLAALVFVRGAKRDWMSRRREQTLLQHLPITRDAYILTLTGYDTFIGDDKLLRDVVEKAYEVRVMLCNPAGDGLRRRVDALPQGITLLSLHGEIEASIRYLATLRMRGTHVSLKFYDHEPFWKVIVLGDHVWVRHYHTGFEVKHQPEYVFALQHHDPRRGLFVPFYVHFLNQWNESRYPEYDFETNELIYRNETGNELRRIPLGVAPDGFPIVATQGSGVWSLKPGGPPEAIA